MDRQDRTNVAWRVQHTRVLSIRILRRTVLALEDLIAQNQRLAKHDEHRASAQRRIMEGLAELDSVRIELSRLESKAADQSLPSR